MKSILRWFLPVLVLAILALPAWVFFDLRGGLQFITNQTDGHVAARLIFPLFGLYAFTLLWLQLMIGSLMPWLKKLYGGIERYHRVQGIFVFLFAMTHPSLLVVGVGLQRYLAKDFVTGNLVPYVLVGQTALLLVILTVVTALVRKVSWVKRWWRLIHLLNYLTFALVWIHSWNLGSDIQSTDLKNLWLVYGATFLAAVIARLLGRTWPRRYPLISRAQAAVPVTQEQPPVSTFTAVAKVGDVMVGKPFCTTLGGQAIAVFLVDGQYYALNNQCSHAGGPLCKGMIDGKTIECPLHFSRFAIQTGAVVAGPAVQPQPTYAVKVVDGQVLVAAK